MKSRQANVGSLPWEQEPQPGPAPVPLAWPGDLHSVGRAVNLGALAAMAIFCAFGALMGLAWWWGGDFYAAIRLLIPGAILALMAPALMWLIWSFRHWLISLERVTGLDLNRDGFIGSPSQVVLLNARHDRPLTPEVEYRQRFINFIKGCEAGPTTEDRWYPVLGEDYERFRDQLIEGGWAKWNHPTVRQQGWVLMATPEEIIKHVD